jgi:signal transduction histidine kinase
MRRASLLWLSLAMLVLLAGMAVLQYRWLGQVSAAERQRMQTSLEERVSQFAAEFDRDVARAFFWLQVDAEALQQRDWTRYADRHDRWLATSAHPQLVLEIWVFTAEGESLRFDPSSRTFGPADPEPLLAPILEEARGGGRQPPGSSAMFRWNRAMREEIPAIVVPVSQILMFNATSRDQRVRLEHRHALAHGGLTVIRLDEDYIRTSLLPSLAERYFTGGDGIEYHVRIASRDDGREIFAYGPPIGQAGGAPDATGELFDVRLDAIADLTAAARLPLLEGGGPEPPPGGRRIVLTPPNDGTAPPVPFDRRIAVNVLQQNPSAGGPERLQSAGPRWRLTLRHKAGSLDAAVGAARRRNLALSGGVLALLASSIIMLVVSTQRASRLAAQQMEFVAAVSHELRTPLAVIRSAGENLADGVVDTPDQVKQYGDLVRREGRRLTMMVEQVLTFAGMRAGDGLRRRPEAVSELIECALQETSAELERAGLSVDRTVPPDLPAACVDRDAIVRALANLLGNAAKYATQGGWVGITASAGAGNRGELEITVADRGPGIAPEDLPHIFEPFYRAASVVATQIHGTGLGLSLVAAIASAHGGRVTVRSAAGTGTAFTLHLPQAAASQPCPARDPIAASRP